MAKNNVAGSELDPQDNLETIEGIGPGYAKALHKIGVHTFVDLAKYDSLSDLRQDLVEQAKVNLPLWRIENTTGKEGSWLDQAKRLAQVSKKKPLTKGVETSRNGEWNEHAGFMVFFESKIEDEGTQIWQTRTYKTENGDVEFFPGVESTPWVNWILEQARLPADMTTLLAEEEAEGLSTEIEIAQDLVTIRISDVDLDEDPRSSILEKKLVAEISLEISGPAAAELIEQQSSFLIELWLIELERNVGQHVAAMNGQLVSETFTYTREATFAMPTPGHYELHTILLLHPPNERLVIFTGPKITVVPEPLNLEAFPALA